MVALKRSNNSKVSNLVVDGSVKIANSFGLPAGITCRGMTSVCKGDGNGVCYAGRIERLRPNVRNALMHNYNTLMACGDRVDKMQTLLQEMVEEFKRECDKHNADKLFRIHWDGDFFSDNYAVAWRGVIVDNPDVKFWVYTRDASAARLLNGSGVTLYFSADKDNHHIAKKMSDEGILIAYLHDTFPDAREGVESIGITRAVKCPENNKKIPRISDNVSACVACGVCIEGRNNVLFSVNKNRIIKKKLKVVALT